MNELPELSRLIISCELRETKIINKIIYNKNVPKPTRGEIFRLALLGFIDTLKYLWRNK